MQEHSEPPRLIAIVTGAGQGIGAAIAERLVDDGMFVVVADVDAAAAVATVERLNASGASTTDGVSGAHGGVTVARATVEHGGDAGAPSGETIVEPPGAGGASIGMAAVAAYIECDVSNESSVRALFRAVDQRFGAVSVLVNNAGIIRDNVIWKMSVEDFDAVLSVNLRGTWLMCREAAIFMRARKSGAIVNVASRAWLGNPGQTNYSASKAGVVGLTRSLALELGRSNVRVNAVAPGLIDTPLTQRLPPDVHAKLVDAQPTRTIGRPSDVADAVAYLASDRSAFITGQVLYVDGGKSIGAGI